MEQSQSQFSGFAVLEVMGHQRFAGYVTTEAYGSTVLFRIDVPALEERERTTVRPGYLPDGRWAPAGAVVKEGAVQGYTKLFGAGSIYCLTPCTEAAALLAVEEMQRRPLMAVTLPPERALPEPEQIRDVNDDDPSDADDDAWEVRQEKDDPSDDDEHASPI